MSFQAYTHMLIVDGPIVELKAGETTVGYEFQLQYPSYRGTFLSCIEALSFQVDDVPLEPKDVVFILNGKQFLLDELKDLFKEYWSVLDYATIRVFKPDGLPAGKHKVNVRIRHRVPYTGYFGQYLTLDADETKELDVQ